MTESKNATVTVYLTGQRTRQLTIDPKSVDSTIHRIATTGFIDEVEADGTINFIPASQILHMKINGPFEVRYR
jgi:hypothetical protein